MLAMVYTNYKVQEQCEPEVLSEVLRTDEEAAVARLKSSRNSPA